jgi:hypothetical protein
MTNFDTFWKKYTIFTFSYSIIQDVVKQGSSHCIEEE